MGRNGPGIYRMWPTVTRTISRQRTDCRIIISGLCFTDRQDRIWVGLTEGLCLLVPTPETGHQIVERIFTKADGLPDNDIWDIGQTLDNRLWT